MKNQTVMLRKFQLVYQSLLVVFLSKSFVQVKAQTAELYYPTDTIQDTVVYRYPAPKSIGIYRISKKFGVKQEDILRWNPQLRERGPQLDEILLIPTGAVIPERDRKNANPATEEKRLSMMPPDEDSLPPADTSRVWRLAVILPLDSHSDDRDEYNDRFYDFYTGLLTAVYQAQSRGMRLEIHTYDIPRTENRLTVVQKDPWIQSVHAIIGPAYTNQVNKMAEWVRDYPVWMLVPFTSHVTGIGANPHILQFNPTSDRKARCLADTIEQHKNSLHCIYVKAKRRPSPEVAYLLQEMKERMIEVDTVPLHVLMKDSADYAAIDSLTNLVILHTDNYSNASVIVPHVKQLATRHDVRILAQDSWVQQEDIAMLRPVYASFFRQPNDYSSVTREYNRLHNHYFSRDSTYTPAIAHPRFDMLGYDLTMHLLELLPKLYENEPAAGKEAETDTYTNADYILSEPFTKGVQSTIRFMRTGVDGGWINEYIQVVY